MKRAGGSLLAFAGAVFGGMLGMMVMNLNLRLLPRKESGPAIGMLLVACLTGLLDGAPFGLVSIAAMDLGVDLSAARERSLALRYVCSMAIATSNVLGVLWEASLRSSGQSSDGGLVNALCLGAVVLVIVTTSRKLVREQRGTRRPARDE